MSECCTCLSDHHASATNGARRAFTHTAWTHFIVNLLTPQLRIATSLAQQMVMPAIFQHRPLVEHQNAVQMSVGRKTMRNNHDGLVLHDFVQFALDEALGYRVEA